MFWWCLCTKVVPKAINPRPDSTTFGEHLSLFIKLFSCTLVFRFSVEAILTLALLLQILIQFLDSSKYILFLLTNACQSAR